MASVSPPQVPTNDGRGPAGRRVSYGPASPRCPTWAERLKVPVWTDDASANFSRFGGVKWDNSVHNFTLRRRHDTKIARLIPLTRAAEYPQEDKDDTIE